MEKRPKRRKHKDNPYEINIIDNNTTIIIIIFFTFFRKSLFILTINPPIFS